MFARSSRGSLIENVRRTATLQWRSAGWAAALVATMSTAGAQVADEPILASFKEQIELTMDEFCYDCHGYGGDKGGVVLDGFGSDEEIMDHALWLRVLKNVRAGLMPPADEYQPSPEQKEEIVRWIKEKAFQIDPAHPDPGRVTVRRLNRVEYRNTIRDLVGIDYNTSVEFPADDTGHGFDNISDVLTISPMLLEKYLDAAQAIIDEAVPRQSSVVATHVIPGGSFVTTAAPMPVLESLGSSDSSAPPAAAANEEIVPAVASESVVVKRRSAEELDLSYYEPAIVSSSFTVEHAGDYEVELNYRALERYVDTQFDLNRCHIILKVDGEVLMEKEMAREGYGRRFSYAFQREWSAGEHEIVMELRPVLPASEQIRNLRIRFDNVTVRGPYDPAHFVSPPNYEKFFPRPVPESRAERAVYARELLGDFSRRAYRRPVADGSVDRLVQLAMGVSEQDGETFESGIAQAMAAVLVSPRFLFREEQLEPLKPGEVYPDIDEYSLASRLSYFLWSTMPDDTLFELAEAGRLREELPQQVQRMLNDPRSDQFVKNFTGQWLQARDIGDVPISDFEVFLRENPNPEMSAARKTFQRINRIPQGQRTEAQTAELRAAFGVFRQFRNLERPELERPVREAMRAETEHYFDYVLREDRDLSEFLDSNYTFLNEELAKFYEIDHVEIKGEEMRKVELPAGHPRGGVLTQGTVLTVTSNPGRTSPVKRGVFILENILGTPPPPPPPNIPGLEEVASEEEIAAMSLREQLELHASSRMCASCHSRMDPLGLALENFNAMGRWRDQEMNKPIDSQGQLVTGESFSGVQELKKILVSNHREQFLHTFTEKLLTYALGRGMEYYDTATLDQIVHRLETEGARPSVLLSAIIDSAPFQKARLPQNQLAVETASAPASEHVANLSR